MHGSHGGALHGVDFDPGALDTSARAGRSEGDRHAAVDGPLEIATERSEGEGDNRAAAGSQRSDGSLEPLLGDPYSS